MNVERGFRIGDLARVSKVKVVTIRYYEQVGLIPPAPRTEGNYRIYGRESRERLCFIRRCRELGFNLDQIRDLLRLASDKTMPCAEVKRIATEHRKAVAAKLAGLQSLEDKLRRIGSSCSGDCIIADCRIVEALSTPHG